MDNVETRSETWQVETGGQIFDASLDEMSAWIADGSLLRIDRVRKNNLRWIEAGKVPQLIEFFNIKDAAEPPPPVVTMTTMEVLGVAEFAAPSLQDRNPEGTAPISSPQPQQGEVCSVHSDTPAVYVCDTCVNSFCKACPTGYGATVKICPFCGAMCRSLAQATVEARAHEERTRGFAGGSFGFSDFGNALAYPFRFKFSLIVGALMFAAFSIGSGAGGFGGIFAMVGGIVCLLCSNMLSFGVLANTVENFSQGKLDGNFMPSFDDFSIWDDVVHPFFLSIGVYISSFGPFIAVILVAAFLVVGAVKGQMTGFQDDAARAVNPELPYAAKAADQSQQIKELVNRTNLSQQQRVDSINNGQVPTSVQQEAEKYQAQAKLHEETTKRTVDAINNGEDPPSSSETFRKVMDEHPDDTDYEALNRVIADQRKAQLESVVGKTPETKAKEQQAFFKQIFGYGALFLILGGITLLWGLFYFPAACAVAGYTRSFAATLNPTVGIDTIKHLGGAYALILVFGLILLFASGLVSGVLNMAFFAFDLPGLGNVPAKFLGSIFGFYLSVVFSCILGYALFKKADKLALPS